jgi:hypothetical protein
MYYIVLNFYNNFCCLYKTLLNKYLYVECFKSLRDIFGEKGIFSGIRSWERRQKGKLLIKWISIQK